MAASKETVLQMLRIFVEEVGLEKAVNIVHRLNTETKGNVSYTATLESLSTQLSDLLAETLDDLRNKNRGRATR